MRSRFLTRDTASPVILITSSMPSEGKTFTAINPAMAYSIINNRTLLIGFDHRRPALCRQLSLPNEKSLSTYLVGRDKLEKIISRTNVENLWVISSGTIPPNQSELTSSLKTQELFIELKKRFDYIIVYSSPAEVVSDNL